MPLLRISDMTHFFGGLRAVHNYNLILEPGHIVGLIGPNGAGKTTALRILLDILEPNQGKALLLGLPFRKAPPELRARVAYLPQKPALPPGSTLEELFPLLAALYPRWDWGLALDLVKRLDVPLDQPLGTLSGGTQRRASLAATFSTGAEVFLLDEPAAGLDPIGRQEFRDLVVDFASSGEGRTLLISTHLIEDLERVADRVGIMKKGKMLLEADLEDLRGAYRKVQAVFPGEGPPPDFRPPGCLTFQVSGPVVQAVVRTEPGRDLEGWTPVPDVRIQEYPLDLEETVLLLLGREKRKEAVR